MQGLRRSKLVTIELEMLEMGRYFILWVPSQEEPRLLSGIDTGSCSVDIHAHHSCGLISLFL